MRRNHLSALLRFYVLRFTFYVALVAPAVLASSLAAPIDQTRLPPASTNHIDFLRDIKPIFDAHCLKCHGPEKPKSGFRLDSREAVLKGGENGKAVEPGRSGQSALIHFVAGLVEDMTMPPVGKGEPLTAAQIGLLRAWIDQGLVWEGAVEPSRQARFEATPMVRWITVKGDEKKFREHQWIREGWDGGVERFDFSDPVGATARLAVSGRVLRDDYRLTLSVEKEGLGYLRGGFEQYRKYFDDSGGFYPPFGRVFSLDRDLHLDKGKAWAEVGGQGPFASQFALGYEYHFTDGEKSLTSWLPATLGGETKNVFPVAKDIDERLHVIHANVRKEWEALRLEDDFRYEFYDLQTRRATVSSATGAPLKNREGTRSDQLANAFRFEKLFTDYALCSGGYLYVHVDADDSFQQTSVDPPGLPVAGALWNGQGITLSSDAHIFNVNAQLGPWQGFTLTAGVQTEWSRQDAWGRVQLDTADFGTDPPTTVTNRSRMSANLDRFISEEKAVLRYTRIPFTVLYAEGRWRREDVGDRGSSVGDATESFLLQRDVRRDWQDYRGGFNISPWRQAALNAWYQRRDRHTDFDEQQDDLSPGVAGIGYPGFLRRRDTSTDEAGARLVLHPSSWLKTTLAYKLVATDYEAVTDPTGASPGGRVDSGHYDSSIYSVNFALTPWQRLRVFTGLSVQDGRTKTEDSGSAAIVPYSGQTYSVIANATYLLDAKTDLNLTYDFSWSDFEQHNAPAGLPLGLEYQRHGLRAGLSRELAKWLRTSFEYVWYRYDEPSGGHFNDYTAHGFFAMARLRWP